MAQRRRKSSLRGTPRLTVVSISEFGARVSALLRQVETARFPLIITHRGKPMVQVVPYSPPAVVSPRTAHTAPRTAHTADNAKLSAKSGLDQVVGILDHLDIGVTDRIIAEMRGKKFIRSRKRTRGKGSR